MHLWQVRDLVADGSDVQGKSSFPCTREYVRGPAVSTHRPSARPYRDCPVRSRGQVRQKRPGTGTGESFRPSTRVVRWEIEETHCCEGRAEEVSSSVYWAPGHGIDVGGGGQGTPPCLTSPRRSPSAATPTSHSESRSQESPSAGSRTP